MFRRSSAVELSDHFAQDAQEKWRGLSSNTRAKERATSPLQLSGSVVTAYLVRFHAKARHSFPFDWTYTGRVLRA